MNDPAGRWRAKPEPKLPAWHAPPRSSLRSRHRKQAIVLISVVLCFIYWQFSYVHTPGPAPLPLDSLSSRAEPTPTNGPALHEEDHPPIPQIPSHPPSTEQQQPIRQPKAEAKEELEISSSKVSKPAEPVQASSVTEPSPVSTTALQEEPKVEEKLFPVGEFTKAFPNPLNVVELLTQASSLPEIIHVPFEAAVAEDTLEGWEDEWVANVNYDVKRWGTFKEPKIDFIYLCKMIKAHVMITSNRTRGERVRNRLQRHYASL